ncbi:hypothetical protein ABK040_010282 [Willaertia magna]
MLKKFQTKIFSSSSLILPQQRLNSNFIISPLICQQQKRFVRANANLNVIIKKDFQYFVEGEVVKVKSGYMRNFLFPNKIADYATEDNLKKLQEELTEEKKNLIESKKRALQKRREEEKRLRRATLEAEGAEEEETTTTTEEEQAEENKEEKQ